MQEMTTILVDFAINTSTVPVTVVARGIIVIPEDEDDNLTK